MRENTCVPPASHPHSEPKLVRPTRELLGVTKGPPESPLHALRCSSPLAQSTLRRKIKNGKLFKHDSVEIVLSSVYCKIGGSVRFVFFVIPFPMTMTSISLVDEHANGMALITSVNTTGLGSFISAISLQGSSKMGLFEKI